jgi:hypothetical protein
MRSAPNESPAIAATRAFVLELCGQVRVFTPTRKHLVSGFGALEPHRAPWDAKLGTCGPDVVPGPRTQGETIGHASDRMATVRTSRANDELSLQHEPTIAKSVFLR